MGNQPHREKLSRRTIAKRQSTTNPSTNTLIFATQPFQSCLFEKYFTWPVSDWQLVEFKQLSHCRDVEYTHLMDIGVCIKLDHGTVDEMQLVLDDKLIKSVICEVCNSFRNVEFNIYKLSQ